MYSFVLKRGYAIAFFYLYSVQCTHDLDSQSGMALKALS